MTLLYRIFYPGKLELVAGPFGPGGANVVMGFATLGPDNYPISAFYGRHSAGRGSAATAYRVLHDHVWQPMTEDGPPDITEHIQRILKNEAFAPLRTQTPVWYKTNARDTVDDEAYQAMLGSRPAVEAAAQRIYYTFMIPVVLVISLVLMAGHFWLHLF